MIIEKYKIEHEEGACWTEVPQSAIVFSAKIEFRGDKIVGYVYALVDPKEKKKIKKDVIWLGTRWFISDDDYNRLEYYDYLGTYHKKGLTYHIWIEPSHDLDMDLVF